MTNELLNKYEQLVKTLTEKKLTITTMESCTGGQIASYITDIEGSSNVIKGAYVTYANETKILNGVDKEVIDKHGVYSFDCAKAMAKACKDKLGADIGIGVTGTFSNIDENNADSIPDNVFVSILFNDEYTCMGVKLVSGLKRYEAKDVIADNVVDRLLSLLKGE